METENKNLLDKYQNVLLKIAEYIDTYGKDVHISLYGQNDSFNEKGLLNIRTTVKDELVNHSCYLL